MKSFHALAVLLAGVSLVTAHSNRSHRRHHRRASSSGSCSPPSSTSTPDRGSSSNSTDTGLVAASWYAGWHSQDVPLDSVSWSKYTHMTYSFAVTTPNVDTLSLQDSDPDVVPKFVEAAKKNNVKALVSVGGWTGSIYFSSNVGSAENRTAFVKTVTQLATNYSLDGIDFDWEYPNATGIGCNIMNPNDTGNFLTFLQALRQDPVGSKLILTAAASINPWNDANKNASTDLSGFADVLDYVAIMNYDIWGSWSATAGPNAPLNDSCAPSPDQQQGSAMGAIKKWNATGIPMNKLVLGVPSYGHSFRVAPGDAFVEGKGNLKSYPNFDKTSTPMGDKWDGKSTGTDVCGNRGSGLPGGNFDYFGLFEGGFLIDDGNGTATVADGIASNFDECSQTPFIYNSSSEVFISYDDPKSFAAKGTHIKSMGLRGFAMWETGGDYKDMLVDSIRDAVGF